MGMIRARCELFPDLQVIPGGLAGPHGTAAVVASPLALCSLTAGKVSWAPEAPPAPCLYCDTLRGAVRKGPVETRSLCR